MQPGHCRAAAVVGALAALCLAPAREAAGFELESVSTTIARAGDGITITGSGFDPGRDYRVLVGEREIVPTSVTADSVSFVVPPDTRTGALGLADAAGIRTLTDTVLDITRRIPADFDPALPLDLAGYGAGTFAGDSESPAAPFVVDVGVGEPTIVSGSRSESDPVFMAVATDSSASVTLGARSTVVAMVFAFPGIHTADPDTAEARLAFIDGLPSVATAASIIEDAVAGGGDFLGAPGLRAPLRDALESTLAFASAALPAPVHDAHGDGGDVPARVEAPGSPPYREDYVQSVFTVPTGSPPFPRYLEVPGFDEEDFRHFPSATAAGDPDGTPIVNHSRDPRGVPTVVLPFTDREWELLPFLTFAGTPVDHLVTAYRLNPSGFDSIDSIRSLAGGLDQVFPRDGNLPIFTDVFPGGGSTRLAGYPLALSPYVDKLVKAVFPTETGNKEVVLPRDRSGVYLIRMFNGTVVSPQDALLPALPDGLSRHRMMFLLNLSLAVLETAGVVVKGGKLRGAAAPLRSSNGSSGGLVGADDIVGIARAMTIEIDRKIVRGEADQAFLIDVFLKGVRQAAKVAFDKALFEPLKPSLKHEVNRTKNILSVLDLLSDLPQAVGRLHFTFNLGHYIGLAAGTPNVWTTMAVDSLVVVVGDPLRPEVTRFSPISGQRGSIVILHGHGFSTVKEENLVRFGDPGTSPEDPLSGSAPARVFAASRTLLVVEVPELEGAAASFESPVFVTVVGRGTVSTERLAPEPSTFTLLPDPEILSIAPDPPNAGSLMEIIGSGFDPAPSRNRVVLDGNIELPVVGGGAGRLVVRAPNSDRPATVRVVAGRRTSDALAFTPVVPEFAPGEAPAGWSMTVSTTADGNAPDANLTLREAMLLAGGGESGGGLGRAITRRPDDSALPWGSYESDWISGWNVPEATPGAASSDGIFFDAGLGPSVFPVADPLPPIRGHDSITGRGHAQTEIRGAGLLIDAANGSSIASLTLSQSAGPGVAITGASSMLRLSGVRVSASSGAGLAITGPVRNVFVDGCLIDAPLGAGIVLGGGAAELFLTATAVRGAASDGIVLEGAVSGCRFDGVDVRGCGGHGIRLAGNGVRLNRFVGVGRFVAGFDLPFGPVESSDHVGFGLVVEDGASENEIDVGDIRGNGLGGILVDGADSSGNRIGPASRELAPSSFPLVAANLGPGVQVAAPRTSIGGLAIAGNRARPGVPAHGILVRGASATDIAVHAVRIGYDHRGAVPAAMANEGSGIVVADGARRIVIGTLRETMDAPAERNFIGGNAGDGIVVAGPDTADIRINHTDVGRAHPGQANVFNLYGRPVVLHPLGNSGHGISIHSGARDVVIGSRQLVRDVHVVAHESGAGIRIAGAATTNVSILGCHIGTGYFGENEGNLHGIHITEGSGGNLIGLPGAPTTVSDAQGVRLFDLASHNTIMGNLDAGILIESGGAIDGTITPGTPPPTPTNANVVVNNLVGTFSPVTDPNSIRRPNRVGIRLQDQALANRIGGSRAGEGNDISFNERAGLEISGVHVPHPALSNRIVGNSISRTGDSAGWPPDFATTPDSALVGIGVLLTDGASGNILGEEGAPHNVLNFNAVGVMIDGAPGGSGDGNGIVQCRTAVNSIAGILLRDTAGNTVGPNCIVRQNGLVAPPSIPYGGIAVIGGSGGNRIVGNIVGSDESPFVLGNAPDGIAILDSPNNQIGEPGPISRNIVVHGARHGILVSGAGSFANRIQGNHIGVHDDAASSLTPIPAPNAGSGIHVRDGAAANRIGGAFTASADGRTVTVPGANRILANGSHGIVVDGPATLGNEILDNSISGHTGGLGIENVNGGNSELPPPVLTEVSPTRISGTVDAARVPDGSIVQVFLDPDDEGRDLVAGTVVRDGAFTVFPAGISAPRVNATVTHVLTRSTSEFSTPADGAAIQGLNVRRRLGSAPEERAVPANAQGAVIVPIELSAVRADALVDRIRLQATGSADESSIISRIRLWRDADADGRVSAGDVEIASAPPPTADNAAVDLAFELIVPDDSVVQLLATAALDGTGPPGQTLEFALTDAQAIDAFGQPTPFPIPETGSFPVRGDRLTLIESGPASGFDALMQAAFPGVTDPTIVGPEADGDGDSATNLAEYAEGADPARPGRPSSLSGERHGAVFVLRFRQRNDDPSLVRTVEFGVAPGIWSPDNARILEEVVVESSGSVDLRELRISLEGLAGDNLFARLVWTLLP